MQLDIKSMQEAAAQQRAEDNARFNAEMSTARQIQEKHAKELQDKLKKSFDLASERKRKEMEAEQEKAARESAENIHAEYAKNNPQYAWTESDSKKALRGMLNKMRTE